jgi:hypothetical protein
MTIDEQEIRRRLAVAAAQASEPRFTIADLTRRIRRIRRRRAWVVTAAAGGAVVAVTVPLALSNTSQPAASHPAAEHPAGPVELSYVVTVNGQTHLIPGRTQPRYVITPGENLRMTVDVTIPPHFTVAGLWLGITNGVLAPRPTGPADMSPILEASTRTPLRPGKHQFTMDWVAPAGLRPGTDRQLSVEWAWSNQAGPATAERIVAELDVQNPAGT